MSVAGSVAMSRATSDALIVRRWREGLTMAQIGARLGMSPEALRRRITRLRRAGVDLPRRGWGSKKQ